MSLGRDIARLDARVRDSGADSSEGTCTEILFADRLVQVNVGGAETLIPWMGAAPWPGDTVRIFQAGQTRVCRSVYGSAQGTIVTVAANIATVTGDDGQTYTYPVAGTFSSGQRVALDHARRIIIGRYLAEPAGSKYQTPPAPPVPAVQDRWFYPLDSGNYRSGAFTPGPVEISDSRAGFYWYGTQIADSIPDTATILTAAVTLAEEWDNVPGTPSKLGRHGQPTRGGQPGLTGSIDVFDGGTVDIMPFAAALASGVSYGLGFAAGFGWRRFGSGSSSGGIHITWS